MKRIFYIIILNIFLSAKEISIYQHIKETNNAFINTLAYLKLKLIENSNNLLPDYLNFDKKTSIFKYSISYNTSTNKLKNSIGINLKLPAFEIKKDVKEEKQNKKFLHYTFKLTIRPIIKLNKPPFLRIKILQKDNNYFSNLYVFDFNTKKQWSFIDKYQLSINKFYSDIYLHTTKEELNDIDYGFGIYYILKQTKTYLIHTGYENNGISNKKPFISYHKLFINYKTHILESKRTTFSLTPYIYLQKNNKFKLKHSISLTLQYQF